MYNRPLDLLIRHIESEEFRGYDPYDILNSPFPFRAFGTYGAAIATQLHKRNPINVRPLLGIRKDYNPKALGLLLYAYAGLQQLRPQIDYEPQLTQLFRLLSENVSTGYRGACWGYNFAWASPGKFLPAYAPSGVVTAFVAKGIHAYYQLSANPEAKKMLLSAAVFADQDLAVTEDATGCCISYTPFKRDCCYNASLLAAETLAMAYSINGHEAYRKKALEAVRFVIARQQADGRWNYSYDEKKGVERKQVDFHQGYVIDAIVAIGQLTGTTIPGAEEAVRKGLSFYRSQQFTNDGQSLWRFPTAYPVDIHNQSQGIITFTRQSAWMKHAGEVDGNHLPFGEVVANWTLKNMFDDSRGYFYYRKYPFFTNRIPYLRWSNAWMMVALVELIQRRSR